MWLSGKWVHHHTSWEAWLKSDLISKALHLPRAPSANGLLWRNNIVITVINIEADQHDVVNLYAFPSQHATHSVCGRLWRNEDGDSDVVKSHLLAFPTRQQKCFFHKAHQVKHSRPFNIFTLYWTSNVFSSLPLCLCVLSLGLDVSLTSVWWGHSYFSLWSLCTKVSRGGGTVAWGWLHLSESLLNLNWGTNLTKNSVNRK